MQSDSVSKQKMISTVSQTVRSKIAAGTWHHSFAKRHRYRYKGVVLFGTWELAYAVWLDRQSIEWIRPTQRFPYTFDGKHHTYLPDFFLPLEQIYVEVKGYAVDKDRAKWDQFPQKLRVLQKEELLGMGVLIHQGQSVVVDPGLISGIEPLTMDRPSRRHRKDMESRASRNRQGKGLIR